MADVSSIVLFPIYLRYHPDGLGGSVKPAHQKLPLPTPKIDGKIQSYANSQAPTNIVMHIQWGAFKSFLNYIVMHIWCIACVWLTKVAVGSHSRKLNKYMEIEVTFALFQQNIISIDGNKAGHLSETEWDSGKEIFWLRDCWLIIHTCEDKNQEWKDIFLLMRSLWKILL